MKLKPFINRHFNSKLTDSSFRGINSERGHFMSYDKIVEKFASEQIRMSLERLHLVDLMTYSTDRKEQYQERILELDMKIQANRQRMKEIYKGGNQK